MYGHTHRVAEAVASGMSHLGEVEVHPISEIDPAGTGELDLLVVGGPTHVHGLSRPSTRRAAITEAEEDDAIELDADAPGPGLRSWLQGLPSVKDRMAVAFDTRIDKPVILVGSAARGIRRHLRSHGFAMVLDPESFFVEGSGGPLADGELERASKWGVDIAHEVGRIQRTRL